MVVINTCVRVVIDGEVFFMGCLNIYFRVDIRENRKNSKKLKKILTYDNVFVNDRHDFQNYCVWIVVHVHLLPRFKFNQDKNKL